MIHYYVDPGTGFVYVQNTSFIWGILLASFGFLLFWFKFFLGFLKRFFRLILIVLLFVAAAILFSIMIQHKSKQKVVILGIDAMDPRITEELIQKGNMPNLAFLKSKGSFSPLKTTIPAESVVAWTSFATGVSPANHGIFGFVMRDAQNYAPYLSLNEIVPTAQGPQVNIRRKAKPFWEILSEQHIPSFIYFCPNTFPPDKIEGRMISGMGVPDISGTMGKSSFYTENPLSVEDKTSRGRVIHVERQENNRIITQIYGPKVSCGTQVAESQIPLTIILLPDKKEVQFEFQGKRFSLKEGIWSPWQKLHFTLGAFNNTYGIVKFYLKSIVPVFELCVSPINFDPESPSFPISYPADYSKKLAKRLGSYYTQGMPHDTWALTEDRFSESVFLEHVDGILQEKENILKYELKEYKNGLFFFYFDTLDVIQHMFWRYIDPKHPLYEDSAVYKNTIFNYYKKIDRIIGEVLKLLDKDTTLIILSDHGFNSYRQSIHLNRWLLENGFLSLKPGVSEGGEFMEDVDWANTKAYALGFGSIYLNKKNREAQGIVSDADEAEVLDSIVKGLKKWRFLEGEDLVVRNVYPKEEVFQGRFSQDAPDLLVGFNSGFRASWQTALGAVPLELSENNKKKWSGEHLIDPELVPGVLFINKKVSLSDPSIVDIASTILHLFDIPNPKEMKNTALF